MKFASVLFILFLSSTFLLLPLAKQPVEIRVQPFNISETIINLQGSSVLVESSINAPIQLTLYRMNGETNELNLQYDESFIEKTREIPTDDRGFYLFVFNSTNLAVIKITEQGVPLISLGYILLMFLIWILAFIRNRYFVFGDY